MRWAVGIDPDKDKCGVAFWDMDARKYSELVCWSYVDIIEKFRDPAFQKWVGIIRVEAGHLIKKSNWDSRKYDPYLKGKSIDQKMRIFEKQAKNVGQNNMVGELLVLHLRRLGYNVEEVMPLGKDDWDSHQKFVRITGYNGKQSNQEKRDAGMLVYEWSRTKCPF